MACFPLLGKHAPAEDSDERVLSARQLARVPEVPTAAPGLRRAHSRATTSLARSESTVHFNDASDHETCVARDVPLPRGKGMIMLAFTFVLVFSPPVSGARMLPLAQRRFASQPPEDTPLSFFVLLPGNSTNDAPALAEADVAVAMNSGTQAAKESGNMVDLNSNPTKLIEIVQTGKQLLMTRGSLTTFSIANKVAKNFAIISAALMRTYPAFDTLNIMRLNPASAILTNVVFNALGHRRAHPTRTARREIQARRSQQASASQSAHLRRRRTHRAVCRHQLG